MLQLAIPRREVPSGESAVDKLMKSYSCTAPYFVDTKLMVTDSIGLCGGIPR